VYIDKCIVEHITVAWVDWQVKEDPGKMTRSQVLQRMTNNEIEHCTVKLCSKSGACICVLVMWI